MLVTLKQIAESIAPLDGREVASVHSQLRNPLISRMLTPAIVGTGRTSAARYNPSEAIRARLLLALQDLGFLSAEITKISEELDASVKAGAIGNEIVHPDSTKGEVGGYHYVDGLHSIIRGTGAGEDWRLRLWVTRTQGGERKVTSRVAWNKWGGGSRGVRGATSLSGATIIGSIEIFASDLIAPLLPLLGED